MNIEAVLVAAGAGNRFSQEFCKQDTVLSGTQTMLDISVNLLCQQPDITKIVVVLRDIQTELNIQDKRIKKVQGGDTRAQSVLKGLAQISETVDTWALVHDAARCCISAKNIQDFIQSIQKSEKGGFMAIAATDTIRLKDMSLLDKDEVLCVQTPQMFPANQLRMSIEKSIQQGLDPNDEAQSILEQGFEAVAYRGYRYNIKITYPEDEVLASALLGS